MGVSRPSTTPKRADPFVLPGLMTFTSEFPGTPRLKLYKMGRWLQVVATLLSLTMRLMTIFLKDTLRNESVWNEGTFDLRVGNLKRLVECPCDRSHAASAYVDTSVSPRGSVVKRAGA